MALPQYIGRRLLQLVPLLLIISFVVFLALSLAPGDPVTLMIGQNASAEKVAEVRDELGLDQPLVVQWMDFVWNALRGDLGNSYVSGRSVTSELARTVGISATLATTSMLLAVVVGVGVGVISATRPHSILDNSLRVTVLALVSMPVFWLGILLIIAFAVAIPLFPAFGWGTYAHLVLPTVALSSYPLAVIARMTRSSMLEELGSEYIRTADAIGLTERRIVIRHALRNALGPVSTVIGLQFGALIGGAVLTETVFGIPGMGRLMINAIEARDYPIVRGTVLTATVIFVLVNLLVDILHRWLDPRQRGDEA